jgi:hypothetical protein
MADEVYATLTDLKKIYKPDSWTTEKEEEASDKLAVASAMVRQAFKKRGIDFNQRLADGNVESLILKDVICTMTRRALTSASGPLGFMELAQISQSAGPMSSSVTPVAGTGSGKLYFGKGELENLGCPTIVFGSMSTFGQENVN